MRAEAGLSRAYPFSPAAAEDLAICRSATTSSPRLECVHDMAQPVAALRRLRELLAPDGIVLIVDERMGDTLGENLTAARPPQLRLERAALPAAGARRS